MRSDAILTISEDTVQELGLTFHPGKRLPFKFSGGAAKLRDAIITRVEPDSSNHAIIVHLNGPPLEHDFEITPELHVEFYEHKYPILNTVGVTAFNFWLINQDKREQDSSEKESRVIQFEPGMTIEQLLN